MASLFLGCFAFGLIFTVAGFLLGALGSGHHLHVPGFDFHGGGHGGVDGGAAHAGDHGATISPFNFSTISAFLAWFGGAGYLLTRYSSLTALLVTVAAAVAGLAGGGIVFLTLTRYVLPRLTVMRPEEYRVQGAVARVTSAIHEGGTGEIVYTLAGARHADGARSASGEALERGAEVVVTRVEKGIAYVERWDKFAGNHQLPPGDSGAA